MNVQALAAVFQSSSDIVGAYYDGAKINLIIGMISYVYSFVLKTYTDGIFFLV